MEQFRPESFGKYYLVDRIATGGMAEIFKAKTFSHGGFENLVVIKRILPHVGVNPDFVEMFIDEAKVSVALQHANIVRVYDFGKQGENYFIAMELVEGKDVRNILRKLSKERQFLPLRLCARIAYEAARGLQYAHTKTNQQGEPYQIVHRDISPSNVIVSYDGGVKVADFGIAKAASNAYETRDGVLKGKFEYMSPEQASGTEIDGRSDVFSLGIILWELLTGRRLFKGDSDLATLKRIQAVDVSPPSTVHPRVPAELDAIVMRALCARETRYADAAAMAEDLWSYLQPVGPDERSSELAEFMATLFASEILEERARLETSSSIAQRMYQETPAPAETWAGPTATRPSVTLTGPRAMVPFVLIFGVAFAAAALAAGVVAVVLISQESMQAPAPSRPGSLEVAVVPAARVLLDGELRGEGSAVSLADLAPGTYALRLEAEGYEPWEERVIVEAGLPVAVAQTLRARVVEAEPVPVPAEPEPQGPAGPPLLIVDSDPSGATVYVGSQAIGKTPLRYTAGAAGASLSLRLELDGYADASGSVKVPQAGGRVSFKRTLTEAAKPGTLTVLLVGGGWANVFVDDVKLGRTAPFRDVALAPGKHTVRVVNAELGVEYSEDVVVGSGQAITVRARAQ